MRRLVRSLLVTAALAAWLAPTGAFADPDELMSCKRLLVKAPPAGPFGNGLTKFVCKPRRAGASPCLRPPRLPTTPFSP